MKPDVSTALPLEQARHRTADMVSRRFGRWTVVGPCVSFQNTRNRTERRWPCRCDCGREKQVLERSLLYGGSQSCGCATAENSAKALRHALKGQTFGDLTVLEEAVDHPRDSRGGVWWRCRCTCGAQCDVLASLLVTGRKTHCGCKSSPDYHFEDITGKTYGRLTALQPLPQRDKKGSVIWRCRCQCGNTVDVSYNRLVYSELRSCGCQKKEHDQMMQSFLTRVDGTSIDMIRSKKLPSDNTSGAKGVYFTRGKWMAKIVFQKKQYFLGKYDHIGDAIHARQEAEAVLFDGAAAHYALWKQRADRDPEWAKQNPIQITVHKEDDNTLTATFLPPLGI